MILIEELLKGLRHMFATSVQKFSCDSIIVRCLIIFRLSEAFLPGGIGRFIILVLLGLSGFFTGLDVGVLRGLSFANVFKSST